MLAQAQGFGFTPPNPYTNPESTGSGGYYTSNTVAQYYQPFPQYSGLSDSTSFVGNENWNAAEVSVRERPANGLDFMVNYTWSKSIDDLGTFRVGDNNHLDRSLSAAIAASESGSHGGLSVACRSRPHVGRQLPVSFHRQRLASLRYRHSFTPAFPC